MGYYVHTTDVEIFLHKDNFDDVYKKMCELNDHDELKRGGAFPRNAEYTGRYNPNAWFSWMDYNYPETCKNLFEILDQIGFEYRLDQFGNLVHLNYPSNKSGNEDYFLCCFAGYVPAGSYVTFQGEEGEYFRYFYTDKDMIFQSGIIDVTFEDMETYVFAELTESDKKIAETIASWKDQDPTNNKDISGPTFHI